MDLKMPKFDDIKDRLGFKDGVAASIGSRMRPSGSAPSNRGNRGDDYGYEDYGEYGFDDTADYAQGGFDDHPSSTGSFAAQMPKLVTADDVRAHTQYAPTFDEAAERADAQATRPNRDFASLRADEQRSPGLNGLFVPSESGNAAQAAFAAQPASSTGALPRDPRTVPAAAASPSAQASAPASAVQPASTAFEPQVVQRSTRIMTVIKPESYAEAERIAKILKAGDVAVLSLRNTPDTLGKRILDFSFGVACALDARVECVSGHVFAISRGAALTEGEQTRLRDQGLM